MGWEQLGSTVLKILKSNSDQVWVYSGHSESHIREEGGGLADRILGKLDFVPSQVLDLLREMAALNAMI